MKKSVEYVLRFINFIFVLSIILLISRIRNYDIKAFFQEKIYFFLIMFFVYLSYKMPFNFISKKMKDKKNTRDLFMEVLLINFILFCLLGMTFFVLNFFYGDDYFYFSFYCITISLLCGRDYIKKKYM